MKRREITKSIARGLLETNKKKKAFSSSTALPTLTSLLGITLPEENAFQVFYYSPVL